MIVFVTARMSSLVRRLHTPALSRFLHGVPEKPLMWSPRSPCFLEKGRVAERYESNPFRIALNKCSKRGRRGEEEPRTRVFREVKAYQPDTLTGYAYHVQRATTSSRTTPSVAVTVAVFLRTATRKTAYLSHYSHFCRSCSSLSNFSANLEVGLYSGYVWRGTRVGRCVSMELKKLLLLLLLLH